MGEERYSRANPRKPETLGDRTNSALADLHQADVPKKVARPNQHAVASFFLLDELAKLRLIASGRSEPISFPNRGDT